MIMRGMESDRLDQGGVKVLEEAIVIFICQMFAGAAH